MLRFRMKMLCKENLMAKTSDIGSCLGLLSGKLLIVGFVVGAFSANAMDQEFKDLNPTQAKMKGAAYKNQVVALQAQLAAQPAPQTPARIAARRDALKEAISNPEGVFKTPLKQVNKGSAKTPGARNLVKQFEEVELTGNDASDFLRLCGVFEVYVQRKTSASNVTTVARLGEERSSEPTDLNDIFKLFKLRLAGIIGPDFLRFYTNEFDVLVVARKAPLHQPAAPVLDLQKEGERYVKKIMSAIESRESLFNLVQEYRPLDEEVIEMHAMLHLMLGSNISDAATAFKPTQDVTTLIEVGDQLRDRFFNTAQLTFIHYMSGQSNKTNVREIIAIINGGRGKPISDSVLFSLNQELEQIFYPRRESGSLTVTTYAFQRPRGSGTSGREPLAIASWPFPLLSATGDLANALFGNCMRPQQGLLTNGDNGGSSSTLAIKDSNEI